jgi:hypothetical protein
MARIAGRRGALYVGLANDTAAASPVPYMKKYTFAATVATIDVTAFGDTTKVYVADLPDAQGTYDGFYDTATSQLYACATDGLARRTYLYPDNSIPGTYFYGTATYDMNLDVDVAGAVAISGSFKAFTPFVKVG